MIISSPLLQRIKYTKAHGAFQISCKRSELKINMNCANRKDLDYTDLAPVNTSNYQSPQEILFIQSHNAIYDLFTIFPSQIRSILGEKESILNKKLLCLNIFQILRYLFLLQFENQARSKNQWLLGIQRDSTEVMVLDLHVIDHDSIPSLHYFPLYHQE